jgi:hypothetical protein
MDRVMQKFVIFTLASLLVAGFGYSILKEDPAIPKIQTLERTMAGAR